MISGQVHSLSCPDDSSVNLQNLPPKRYMPSMLQYLCIKIVNVFENVSKMEPKKTENETLKQNATETK